MRLTGIVLTALAALFLVAGTANAAAPRSSFGEDRNIVYAERPGVKLRLDVRRLPTFSNAPIVLLLHGGGWWYGRRADLMDTTPVASTFAAAGFVAISIDYRLACGTREASRRRYGVTYDRGTPMCGAFVADQVQDVQDAVRFVRANATRWGGDPNRITMLGASAGGHLALLAAATAPPDARVSAVANWSGPSSNRFIAAQDPYRKPSIIASFTNAVGCMWVASPACKARWDAASPYARVSSTSPKFAVLAVSGIHERQVPASTHRQFGVKLQRLGFPSRVISLPSWCHGAGCRTQLVRGPRGYRTVEATTVSFLATYSRSS